MSPISPERGAAEHEALGARSPSTTGATTRRTRRPSRTPNTTRLRQRYEALEARFPELKTAESLTAEGRREGLREVRQGPPPRADAVARQRLRGRGRARVRRAHPPLPAAQGRGAARLHGGAQDRRPVAEPALRERAPRHRRDARRRRRGRGRHGQCAHGRRHPAAAEGRRMCRRSARCAARSISRMPISPRSTSARPPPASRSSPIRATPRRAACASSTRRSPPRAPCASSPMPGAR